MYVLKKPCEQIRFPKGIGYSVYNDRSRPSQKEIKHKPIKFLSKNLDHLMDKIFSFFFQFSITFLFIFEYKSFKVNFIILNLQCCQFLPFNKVNQLHISTIFKIIFPYRLLQNIEYRVPCAIQQVLIHYLCYIQQCTSITVSQFIFSPSFPFGNYKLVFYIYEFIFVQ